LSDGVTEVAGQTGVVSEEDTARLALATEAALVGNDPAIAGGAVARSMADEMSSAQQALADAAAAATTTLPPTTAAPAVSTTAAPATTTTTVTTAAAEQEADTSASADTTAATSAEDVGGDTSVSESTSSETTASPETTIAEDPETTAVETTAAETTAVETTVPETTVPETTVSETTVPATTSPETTSPDGWVDTGNGVLVPPVLLAIRWCESRDDYVAANPSSSARGAYQFLTGSWKAYGHKDRYGVSQAHLATPVQQDEAALITWERDGTRPWNASKSCWSKRI
jgi:hypothetical protein